jgi:putative spermidine/putrescine transport system permease protein
MNLMTTTAENVLALPVARRRGLSLTWLGLAPFFLFAFLVMLLPSAIIIFGSFQDAQGHLTLANLTSFSDPTVIHAYVTSLQLSIVTGLVGGLLGLLIAIATLLGRLPRFIHSAIITFSGVASNFAGVPLAFAFVATLGRTGFVTALFRAAGFDLYGAGFTVYSLTGLSLCYIYFQFPLMILIIAPSLEGLRREWREATENLGGNTYIYWRYVALPVLLPSILGTMILLFGNSFGAYATAYALTGGQINLITLQISKQITGDVFNQPGVGYALSLGMVVIMALCIGLYTWLQRKTERWLR